MTKKTPTIGQLLQAPSETLQTPSTPRTIWNTNCGGYPAGELISLTAGGGKSSQSALKKPARARAKAL